MTKRWGPNLRSEPTKTKRSASKKRRCADKNVLRDARGHERIPGHDPKTGKYSTAQMMADEMFGGDTSRPLFD